MTAWYVDTSAFVRLIRREPHSAALGRWVAHALRTGDELCVSDLVRTEAMRVARRGDDDDALERTTALADALLLVRVSPATFDRAGTIDPPELRSLDALHLAVASELGDDLAGIVTYDQRLLTAAAALGFPTASPGVAT